MKRAGVLNACPFSSIRFIRFLTAFFFAPLYLRVSSLHPAQTVNLSAEGAIKFSLSSVYSAVGKIHIQRKDAEKKVERNKIFLCILASLR
ncbi:MAG TPA: hypothetical protein VGB38_09670 [bacterium]